MDAAVEVRTLPWQGYLLAAVGSAMFASKAIVVKLAYLSVPASEGTASEIIDPISLIVLRMGFAVPLYLIIGLLMYRKRMRSDADLPPLRRIGQIAVIGAMGYYVASFLDFVGLVHITAQLERLTLFTYPAFVVILSALIYRHPITRAAVVGFGISYFGLAFVLINGEITESNNLALGVSLVLGAALSFAFYQTLSKTLMQNLGSVLFTCVAMSAAALCALIHFVILGAGAEGQLALMFTPRMLRLGAVLGIGCTVVPSFFLSEAIERVGPQAVAIIGTLSPVVTVALAVLLLHEPFGWQDAVGALLVIAGVMVYVRSTGKRPA